MHFPDQNNLPAVWDSFQTYFEPKSNFRLARFQLRDMRQETNESIDDFITPLRVQSQKCHFGDLACTDDAILDHIIKGLAHSQV